jgi:hypothetical protein
MMPIVKVVPLAVFAGTVVPAAAPVVVALVLLPLLPQAVTPTTAAHAAANTLADLYRTPMPI